MQNFRGAKWLIPYHETRNTFIGLTSDMGYAQHLLVNSSDVMEIQESQWPTEIAKLRKVVIMVLKEVGMRSYMVVTRGDYEL